jgi:AcrR family transcriptional regulator
VGYVKAKDRHRQIVNAAIKVLSEAGVPDTTLRGVAAAAGIPLGTLYYVFPSKDQLLRAVIAAVTDEIAATLREELVLDRGVEHALRHGIRNFWSKLVESDMGLQIMQYELSTYSLRTEGPGGLASVQYERYVSLVTDLCEQAAKAAGERCAVSFDSLGRITLAIIDGLILQFVASPDHARALRDLNLALDMIIGLADPQPVAPTRSRP